MHLTAPQSKYINLVKAGGEPLAPSVHALLNVCGHFSEKTRLRFRGGGLLFPKRYKGTLHEIERMVWLREKAIEDCSESPIMLATEKNDAFFYLTIGEEFNWLGPPWQRATFDFDGVLPILADEDRFTLNELMDFVGVTAKAFGADRVEVVDTLFRQVVYSKISYETAKASLPESLWLRYRAEQDDLTEISDNIQFIASIAHPAGYDVYHIPPYVSWINYWNSEIVDTIGRTTIRQAPWSELREIDDGGMILVTQQDEFDIFNEAHSGRLVEITRALGLYELQRG